MLVEIVRSLILVDLPLAIYFVWKFPPFAPYLPPILARNVPYFALFFFILAPNEMWPVGG